MKSINKLLILLIYTLIIYYLGFTSSSKQTIIIEKPKILNPISLKVEKPSIDQEYKEKAFMLLNSYIGKKGDCYEIAISYIKELKGITNSKLIKITEKELMIGDLIFYSDNGNGLTHWAVYLDENIALHGSGRYDKTTIIKRIKLKNMSRPTYYRVIEK